MATSNRAAIFDLDRTLLLGSSAPVFQRHMAQHGLGGETAHQGPLHQAVGRATSVLGHGYNKIYETFGESAVLMQAARLGARMARGWDVQEVQAAAEAAAHELVEQIQPWARMQIRTHQEAGELVVMATTSPEPWVQPLADLLGFDHVVATRWLPDGHHYTGRTDGPFLWGREKAKAVQQWAEDNNVHLTRSTAYSDSYFDTPLLTAVGNAVAVNPDPRLHGLALLKGWPIRYFDAPEGVIKIAGRELQEIFAPLGRKEFLPNARFSFSGMENIPKTGGAILVANHRSYFDPTVMSLIVAMSGRRARFLGKKEVFDAPVLGWLAAAAGGIRVERASGSDEPLQRAAEVLEAGDLIVLMPEGTIPRGPAFFDPKLKGRWGAARLAEMTEAPVIPIGLWGTEKVWPRSARLPNLSPIDPPTIEVSVGPAVPLKYRSPKKDTKRIMTAISAQLPAEASTIIEPTAEQLAATYPPGYSGDPAAEANRRPGQDA